MTMNTTLTATPATLTEQELFAAFIQTPVATRTTYGAVSDKDSYLPADYLHVYGEYGELEDAGDMLMDHIIDSEEPEDYLRSLADSMENYATDLRKVLADFHTFKLLHSTEADLGEEPEDQKSEAYEAWCAAYDEHDRNPRFRVPVAAEGEAA